MKTLATNIKQYAKDIDLGYLNNAKGLIHENLNTTETLADLVGVLYNQGLTNGFTSDRIGDTR